MTDIACRDCGRESKPSFLRCDKCLDSRRNSKARYRRKSNLVLWCTKEYIGKCKAEDIATEVALRAWIRACRLRDRPRPTREQVDLKNASDSRAQYWNNPEKHRIRKQIYRHANPDKLIAWKGKRARVELEQSDGTLTTRALRALFGGARGCAPIAPIHTGRAGAVLTISSRFPMVAFMASGTF